METTNKNEITYNDPESYNSINKDWDFNSLIYQHVRNINNLSLSNNLEDSYKLVSGIQQLHDILSPKFNEKFEEEYERLLDEKNNHVIAFNEVLEVERKKCVPIYKIRSLIHSHEEWLLDWERKHFRLLMDLIVNKFGKKVISSISAVSYFIDYGKDRIERNKNFLIAITGQTGSGKSYAALKLAQMFQKDFSIKNVATSPTEFMSLIEDKVNFLKSGDVIVWDEYQIQMSNLDFQTLQSKLINAVLQTFRHRNIILIITTPNFSFINAGSRKLFHCCIETMKINKKNNMNKLRPLFLQASQEDSTVYRKYLTFEEYEEQRELRYMWVGLPSKDIITSYEQKKTEYTQKLNETIHKQLNKLNDDGIILTDNQKEILELLKQGLLIKDIARQREVDNKSIYSAVAAIKKKGIIIKPIKEHRRVIKYEVIGSNT